MGNNIEIWKGIKEFDNCYEISNFGRIKSTERYVINTRQGSLRKIEEKFLYIGNNGNGYLTFRGSHKNKRFVRYIHRLVAENFLNKKEGKNIVNHIDCDKSNNNFKNLEWVDSRGNAIHNNAHIKRGINKRKDLKIYEKISVRRQCFKEKLKIRGLEFSDYIEIFDYIEDNGSYTKKYFYFKKC